MGSDAAAGTTTISSGVPLETLMAAGLAWQEGWEYEVSA